MLGDFLKIDFYVVCFFKTLDICLILMKKDTQSCKQDRWQASRQFTWRLACYTTCLHIHVHEVGFSTVRVKTKSARVSAMASSIPQWSRCGASAFGYEGRGFESRGKRDLPCELLLIYIRCEYWLCIQGEDLSVMNLSCKNLLHK